MQKFLCWHCSRTLVLKTPIDDDIKCKCGRIMNMIVKEANIGKMIKIRLYEQRILKGTPYLTIEAFRDSDDAEYCEELKVATIRKYGDLAIGDRVRMSECVFNKIKNAVERYSRIILNEVQAGNIKSMEGGVVGCNIRKDMYAVKWDPEAEKIAAAFNLKGFDFFDLAGDWNSYDLDRIITNKDVGRTGTVNREGGLSGSGVGGPVSM